MWFHRILAGVGALPYYIAAINIEEAFHGRAKKHYEPFEGIVLTDTFQLSEGEGAFDDPNFQVNSARALQQNKRDIRVIIGNPPYSAAQGIRKVEDSGCTLSPVHEDAPLF